MVPGVQRVVPQDLSGIVAQMDATAAEWGLQLHSVKLSGMAGPLSLISFKFVFDGAVSRLTAGSRKRSRGDMEAMPAGGDRLEARTSTVEAAGGHPLLPQGPLDKQLCGGCTGAALVDDIGEQVASDGVAPRMPAVEVPGGDDVAAFLRGAMRWDPLEQEREEWRGVK